MYMYSNWRISSEMVKVSEMMKRNREEAKIDGSESYNGQLENKKNSIKKLRRSRWEEADNESYDKTNNVIPLPSPPKQSLDDIVKKLSSVVKQAPASKNSTSTTVNLEAARAKALAQASLLSQNLPNSQFSNTDLARRLYIGNLYYELREEDIRNFFAPFGGIHAIDLSMEPGCGRSKGFCFLEYDDVLGAESAVQVLNGAQLANRSIKVGRPHRGSSNSNDATAALNFGKEAIKSVSTPCIYIGGVRQELGSRELESIFAPFGSIKACVMTAVSPHETDMHRGYGFMEFMDENCALSAIKHMNGFELAGQHLKVGKASPSAMVINLATSKDKIVRNASGELQNGSNFPLNVPLQRKTLDFDDEGVEAIKDDVELDKNCICLLNLVEKGDVDDELEEEVRIECSRSGPVRNVDIVELKDEVRIFVSFTTNEAAKIAKDSLHGRFFSGNQVKAYFYPQNQLQVKNYTASFL